MTATPPEPVVGASGEVVPAWAIRMEAKIDVALTQHTARLDNHAQDIADHEARLREVEQRKTVSPWQLWLAISGGIGALGAVIAVVVSLLTL